MPDYSNITPTMSVPLFDGEVTVHAFGREHGCNFSFMGIDTSQDPHYTHPQIFAALGSVPGLADFYAPSPTQMNAKVVSPFDLIHSPEAKVWEGNRTVTPQGNFRLHRGLFADGLTGLTPWIGYAMSAADCALIVVRSEDIIIAAHAGRESILDMKRLKGEPPREKESVVDTICEKVLSANQVRNAEVWVGFSISPGRHFEHVVGNPAFPVNDVLVKYVTDRYGKICFKDDGQDGLRGWLDTKELIRQQFLRAGVDEKNITLDTMCTYSDTKDGEHMWYSNKRSGSYRNLIAVVVNT